MKRELRITWDEANSMALHVLEKLKKAPVAVYPVPRGGIYAALILQNQAMRSNMAVMIVNDLQDADIVIDDIIDSGATRRRYKDLCRRPFHALVDKSSSKEDAWYIFPWEQYNNETGPQENIKRILEYIGEDPEREGLIETPDRVVKSYQELYCGYGMKVEDLIKVFEDGACDEMVILKDIEFYSNCEHHMLPFFGKAHIAYIPDKQVIGVSKLARILEVFSRRLQIQERLCQQVTNALDDLLCPKGSACILEAEHFCMTSRGVQK